ncbi:replication protein A 70 kDa DNA-binding subunit D [Daucus carota subsp. sativus]|uniref:replication protein A 70 kDa DNA-binding subunit D n=1 Tax=Daucus carota subsp. sativus TaxID=79200 RepID=UPI0007EF4213|nr:PREDICTED: replication protein A 70 kDa DNA-binding subunit D-like [Daucus carota subsp. sativus]
MSGPGKYDSLDSLDDSKYEWKIRVRVIRIWDSYSNKGQKEFKGRNMLLLDDKHQRMHAFIWPNYLDEFKNMFVEGNVYSIRNFSVKTYRKESLRCTRYDKQIWLSNYTKVFPVEDEQKMERAIRPVEFDFFDIADIGELVKQSDNNFLIDVIGILMDKEVLRRFKNQREVEQCSFRFTITDGSASIKCCFWDDMAEKFSAAIENENETPLIVIIASCKHNEYKEEPYVSNVAATRFYINHNHRSVLQMKQRASMPDFTYTPPTRAETPKTQIMTVAQLRKLDSKFNMNLVMCQVTVKSVEESKIWYFDACSSCGKEIEVVNGKYRCEECKRNIPFPEKRFRIYVIAEDLSGAAAFVVVDPEVENIIEKSVFDVLIDQSQEKQGSGFPSVLKLFEGNQYTFTIRLNGDNLDRASNTYFVTDISKGHEIMDNNVADEDSFSTGPMNVQFSDSASISIADFKTPDTEKSTNTNRLKRLSGDDVVLIASLSDDNDLAAGGVKEKESLTVKHVKKEKV